MTHSCHVPILALFNMVATRWTEPAPQAAVADPTADLEGSTAHGHTHTTESPLSTHREKEDRHSMHSNTKTRNTMSVKNLVSTIIPAAILVIIGFWVSVIHLYGLVFEQGKFTSKVTVPVVDFDGGAIGQAFIQTASSMSGGYNYPTYEIISAATTCPDQLEKDVYKGKYWAALYVEAGATARWEAAVNGSSTEPYEADNTIKYILMNARYYTFYQQPFYATSLTVSQAASAAFGQSTAVPSLAEASSSTLTEAQSAAYLSPITPTEINANRAGVYANVYDKVFYNTVGAVLPILMQFFFLMAVNGVSSANDIYSTWSRTKIHVLRHTLRFVWPLIASLCSVGWSWAYKGSGYHLEGQWFLAFWAVTYLYCSVSFNVLDLATTYVPMAFMSQIVLPWIIFNVAASLCSPQILHGWYGVSYFFPAHHWWELSMMVLTKGGLTSTLHYTLPVLLSWWVLTGVLSIFGTRSRIIKERAAGPSSH